MELQEIQQIQYNFSKKAFPEFWKIKDEDEKILRLEFFSNALNGEAGEFANIVKKLVRDKLYRKQDVSLKDYYEKLEEELTDVFIYVLNIASLLDIDLERAFFKKLEINKRRFLK